MSVEFANGLRIFKPREGAPEFIKGAIVINKGELIQWLSGKGDEVRLDIKESKKGSWYASVNDYRPNKPQDNF